MHRRSNSPGLQSFSTTAKDSSFETRARAAHLWRTLASNSPIRSPRLSSATAANNKQGIQMQQAAGAATEGLRRENKPRAKLVSESCHIFGHVPGTERPEPCSSGVPQDRGSVCRVHQCLPSTSPNFVRDHLPSSNCSYGPTPNQSNGQVPSSSRDLHQQHQCCNCHQQEARATYSMPHLPGHEEKSTLCSHHSSVNPSADVSQHQNTKCQWKQWSHDEQHPRQVQHHIVAVRHAKAFKMPRSYSQVIADWPVAVLVMCSVVVLLCTLSGLLVGPLPDFSEPLLGFEPRDTDIGRKLVVWKNIQSHTGYKKTLSLYPYTEKSSYNDIDRSSRTENMMHSKQEPRSRRMVEQDHGKDGSFCGPPGKGYSQLIFISKTAGSLWNLQAIQSMCQIEQEKIRSHASFEDLCERTDTSECCPSWSLGNYIAVLYNRSSCLEITQADITHTLALLRSCAPDYHSGMLIPSCIGPKTGREKHSQCAKVPEKCTRFSAIYQLLHYLVDKDFLSPQTIDYQVPSLKYSLLFLPMKKGASMMNIYQDNLESIDLFDNYTSITGMDFGLKQKLFQQYLTLDTVYPVLAILAIFLFMSFYLRSVFITFMVMIAIISSLMISFFLYKVAFRFTFFPFVNLTAIVILTSICANHTFVFFDLWSCIKVQNPSADLLQWVSQTMHHFAYLMLVSCFTTAAAFFASYMSNITAVRCFAIYMGTSVLVNLAFMMTWVPASMVLYEYYIATNCMYKPEDYWNSSGHKRFILSFYHKLRDLQNTLSQTSKLLFEKLLPCGVIKFRYIWICWFAALAIGGAYIACFNPKLKLPTSEISSIQVFRLSHPFERYDAEYCHQFMFERLEHGEGQRMPIMLVWGIMPIDNGDHFDPKSNGTLMTDDTFTIQNPEAQKWLLEFCHKVKNQTFYYPGTEKKDTVCFMEEFLKWMGSRQCSQTDHNLSFCCNHFSFPYQSDVILHCMKMMIIEQSGDRTNAIDLGPRFDVKGNLIALVLEFQTIYHYSFNYSKAKLFYNKVSHWLVNEIKTAPIGLKNGWFMSNLDLYSIQHSLSTETMMVIGLSIAISFVMLLLTTWNVLLSIFSSTAIGGTVLVTMGLLVLLEWQLNAVECLFISAAVGLSVDFTVNYCISYHVCPHSDRLSRVAFSLKQMSCATAMAASALFSAGVIMLPATVLAYRKLGIFMMMIKCISCAFSSFFFQTLCCFFGPESNCGQILWPCSSILKEYPDDTKQNGTFACGGHEKQNRLLKVQESSRDNEQYELQPLARNLSDSFDNSTSTSKLSNRPSVFSEDLHFQDNMCSRVGIDHLLKVDTQTFQENVGHQVAFNQCPALQTSSPYKQSNSGTEIEDNGKRICKDYRCLKYKQKPWNGSMMVHLRSASMEDELQRDSSHGTRDNVRLQTILNSGNQQLPKPETYEFSRCFCSSGSSFDILNDSNETCLSDVDPSTKLAGSTCSSSDVGEIAASSCYSERGHLNTKRDTLRLSLKETVFDMSPQTSQQNSSWKNRAVLSHEGLVVLPNSRSDMPDVWIRRSSDQNSNT